MSFAIRHLVDILCMLAGLLFLISVIRKTSRNLRGLILYWIAALMLLTGGSLGLLHGFQNIEWVHRHQYSVFYYGQLLREMAVGMMLVLLLLGVNKEFELAKKTSQS